MNLNPEFRRNLWLELTPLRAVLVGALLLLALVAAAAAELAARGSSWLGSGHLAATATGGFVVLVVIWGGWQAAAAVVTEIRERTWDGQRMSSLGAWSLSWGKLFGVTSLAWCYGLVCIAVLVAARPGASSAIDAATLIGAGLLCQATALCTSLIRASSRAGAKPGNATLLFLLSLGFTYFIVYLPAFAGGIGGQAGRRIVFFGWPVAVEVAQAAAAWIFAAIMLGGAHWRMRLALQVEARPWMWLLFLAALATYVGGIAGASRVPELGTHVVVATLAAVAYCLILIEPKDAVQLSRAFGAGGRFAPGAAFARAPLWLLTYLSVLVAVGVAIAAYAEASGQPQGLLFERFVGSPTTAFLAVALFVTRDIGIVLAFALGRNARRAEAYGFLCWLALYVPLPLLMLTLASGEYLFLVLPTGHPSFALGIAPALIQAAIVLAIVILRWRRLGAPR
jgi:uncharacterized membrane protein